MQILKPNQMPILRNSGIESEQLLFPESCPEARVTLTRVTIPPGAISPRHAHPDSEQVWLAVSGRGTLLLAGDRETPLQEGDVLRLAPGDVHGFFNGSERPFVYISVTTPPLNFRGAYEKDWRATPGGA
jgi:quercetin dioxygenase-like cupin family protein